MEKNIAVVDEQGKRYGSTWPKRARGLVKKGRARFIGEHTICLARLPDDRKETVQMNEQQTVQDVEYSIPGILRQIAAIQADTQYQREILTQLAGMTDGDSGGPGSPGNLQGQAKAEALRGAIMSHETTNQQLLRLYEKMYDDLIKTQPKW